MTSRPEGDFSVLSATGVVRCYRDGSVVRRVLDGVSLRVAAGEAVAITGPSGSGKSTLLQILGGLERPDRGTVLWGDRRIDHLNERRLSALRRHWVGFVFQEALLVEPFTALENISLALKLARREPESGRGPLDILRDVGVETRAHHRHKELSGGEAQRVALARALVKAPRILLADEPTANLDQATGRGIVELIERLCVSLNFACLIATHDRGVARVADRSYELRGGRLHMEQQNGEQGR